MSLLYNIHHNMGIVFINIATLYLLIITIRKKKALVPATFFILEGIGSLLILREMWIDNKPFVIINEILAVIMSIFLAVYSFLYYKK